MNILGVCNANDSGAAVLVNGKLVAAANEERFCRKKLFQGVPTQSIAWCLKQAKLTVKDIDWIGCGAWNGVDNATTLPLIIDDLFTIEDASGPIGRELGQKRISVSTSRDKQFKDEIINGLIGLGFSKEKLLFCDHHYSHALTAFLPSPFGEALVFCADGRGDGRSVTLWSATRKNGVKLIDEATELVSPGVLYGFITKLLGFIPDRHEGKVTGLAAHGKKTFAYDLLKSGLYYDSGVQRIRAKYGECFRPFGSAELPKLKEALAELSREDFAWAVQALLEEILLLFINKHISKSPKKSVNLCLAGGCMGNVKLNFELGRHPAVKNVYVFPHMGDGGSACGGALHVAIEKSGLKSIEMPTAYLGPEYSNDEIYKTFKNAGLDPKKILPTVKAQQVAAWINEGLIIGWFQGRMEYGPRALGARSILANPSRKEINEELNHRLQRSEFMPFAPVTTTELAPKCFIGWAPEQICSQFMTICYECYPIVKEKAPAVVHVDNTARPQVVIRELNPEYYGVVEEFHSLTGIPCLVNTSFNHHEEPILNSPEDAVRSFNKGNVDILVAGDWYVGRKSIIMA